MAAAALGVFWEGGYSADSRVTFGIAAMVAVGIAGVAAREARAAARQPLVIVLAALALLGAASALWTVGLEARALRWAAVTAGYAAIVVSAAAAARTARGRLALAIGIAAIAAVASVVALGGLILREPPYAVRVGGGWRAAGPLEYPPALALLAVSALPIAFAGVRAGSAWLRAVALVSLGVFAGVLAFADSRTGLALGLAVAAVALYRLTRRPLVLLAGAVVAVVAGAAAFGAGDGPPGGFLHGRDETWEAAIETFLDRPLQGAGADAFLAASARHQEGAAIDFAHSLPLELAAELGVAGLILALALYAAAGWLLWTRRADVAAWIFGPAVVAFPLANLLDWPWHLAGCGAIWAVACGALAGTRGYEAKVRETIGSESP